jgi:hypothetical protein
MALVNSLPDKSREYSLQDDPSRIPDNYLSALAMKTLGEDFFSSRNYDTPREYPYSSRNYDTTKEFTYSDFSGRPERVIDPAIYRDALRGAQTYADNNWWATTRGTFPDAVKRRLNDMESILSKAPHQMYSPTGTDYYRLRYPDSYVAPYAKTYNEEQMPDIVVPEYRREPVPVKTKTVDSGDNWLEVELLP